MFRGDILKTWSKEQLSVGQKLVLPTGNQIEWSALSTANQFSDVVDLKAEPGWEVIGYHYYTR
jgi:hypothetical protein